MRRSSMIDGSDPTRPCWRVPRSDRLGQERARPRAGGAVRRRGHQLRFDGRLSRVRHRHRQAADRGPARHSASPDRHRRPDRGLHGRAVRARRRAGDSRHSRARAPADSDRRDRLLLPGADARPVSGPGRRRGAARPAESGRATGAASSACIACCSGSIRSRRRASCRAIASGSSGRSRSTSRPAAR